MVCDPLSVAVAELVVTLNFTTLLYSVHPPETTFLLTQVVWVNVNEAMSSPVSPPISLKPPLEELVLSSHVYVALATLVAFIASDVEPVQKP
jgi:hypothetical protein